MHFVNVAEAEREREWFVCLAESRWLQVCSVKCVSDDSCETRYRYTVHLCVKEKGKTGLCCLLGIFHACMYNRGRLFENFRGLDEIMSEFYTN